ncbi:MAG: PmbA/TldA family metallopeptidase [Candidatus Malihini olakiniferum]
MLNKRHLDYADLYFKSNYHESWVLENHIIQDSSYNIDREGGIYSVSEEKIGFAYAIRLRLMHCIKARNYRTRAGRCRSIL